LTRLIRLVRTHSAVSIARLDEIGEVTDLVPAPQHRTAFEANFAGIFGTPGTPSVEVLRLPRLPLLNRLNIAHGPSDTSLASTTTTTIVVVIVVRRARIASITVVSGVGTAIVGGSLGGFGSGRIGSGLGGSWSGRTRLATLGGGGGRGSSPLLCSYKIVEVVATSMVLDRKGSDWSRPKGSDDGQAGDGEEIE
jgi:hypothetical protein